MADPTTLIIQSLIQRGSNLSISGNRDGTVGESGPSITIGPLESVSVELRTVQFDRQFLDTLSSYVDNGKATATLSGEFGTLSLTADEVQELRRRDLTDILDTVPAHVLDGVKHTVSGLTPGDVLTATGATAFGFTTPSLLLDLPSMTVGRDAVVTNSYLRGGGNVPTNVAGFLLSFDATIVGISAVTNGAFTWAAEVRKNGAAPPIASLAIVAAASGYTALTLGVDTDAGDIIEMYCNGGNINRPHMMVYYKRR